MSTGAAASATRSCRSRFRTSPAERLGVPASALQQLGWNFDAVPEKMQPVLRIARKLTQQPSSVTKADEPCRREIDEERLDPLVEAAGDHQPERQD
jgi:hypothetical protein